VDHFNSRRVTLIEAPNVRYEDKQFAMLLRRRKPSAPLKGKKVTQNKAPEPLIRTSRFKTDRSVRSLSDLTLEL